MPALDWMEGRVANIETAVIGEGRLGEEAMLLYIDFIDFSLGSFFLIIVANIINILTIV